MPTYACKCQTNVYLLLHVLLSMMMIMIMIGIVIIVSGGGGMCWGPPEKRSLSDAVSLA